MNREDLLDDVRELAGPESADATESAVVATLLTLGEHVSEGEAEDLAAGLPQGLRETVTDRRDETPESYTVEVFANRVAEREGNEDVDREAATRHVRAVMAALAGRSPAETTERRHATEHPLSSRTTPERTITPATTTTIPDPGL